MPLRRARRRSFPSHAKDPGWSCTSRFSKRAQEGNIDLLFLGDSITQGWDGARKRGTGSTGPRKAANFGIGGDRTQHVLWRIQNGELDGIEPKVIVLMIGTNNASDDTPDEIAQGITAIVGELRERLPKTKVLLLGVFPESQKPDAVRERLKSVNEKIAKLDDGSNVRYLDIGKAFLNDDGTISQGDHARLSSPEPEGLSPLGRRHGADALVDARRTERGSREGSPRPKILTSPALILCRFALRPEGAQQISPGHRPRLLPTSFSLVSANYGHRRPWQSTGWGWRMTRVNGVDT